MEFAELSIPVDQQDITGKPLLKVRRNDAVGHPLRIGVFRTVYYDLYHFLFFHMTASYM